MSKNLFENIVKPINQRVDQKSNELKCEAYFISSQEKLYVFVQSPPIYMTPNAKAKAVPMDS